MSTLVQFDFAEVSARLVCFRRAICVKQNIVDDDDDDYDDSSTYVLRGVVYVEGTGGA